MELSKEAQGRGASSCPVSPQQSHYSQIFIFRGRVKFLQKDKASPVVLVLVLAGAMFAVIHHGWKVPNDVLP